LYSISTSNISSPPVVNNGKILELDASNSASYPGYGAYWKDVSGSRQLALLVNSPSFDTTSKSFLLDGSTQYIKLTNSSLYNFSGNQSFTLLVYGKVNETGLDSGIITMLNEGVGYEYALNLDYSR